MKGSFLDRSSRCPDWQSIQASHRILLRLGHNRMFQTLFLLNFSSNTTNATTYRPTGGTTDTAVN